MSEHFKVLGVQGDEASLRQAILAYPVTSNEYHHLGSFVGQAHAEHYASRVRAEIVDLLRQAEATLSTARLREAACSPKSATFIDSFVRKNLGNACDDDAQWVRRAIEFASKALMPLGEAGSYAWWQISAKNKIVFMPTDVRRTVGLAELVKMAHGQQLSGDYVQANVTMSLMETVAGTVIDIFDPTTGFPVVSLAYANANVKQQPCWVRLPNTANLHDQAQFRKPKCAARLTLHADAGRGLRVLAVENMRPLTGSATATSPTVKR